MSSSANNVFFDDDTTLAMGAAFDRACSSLGRSARHDSARELIAKRIIEAATKGERDPVRLHSQVIMRFWVPVGVGREWPRRDAHRHPRSGSAHRMNTAAQLFRISLGHSHPPARRRYGGWPVFASAAAGEPSRHSDGAAAGRWCRLLQHWPTR